MIILMSFLAFNCVKDNYAERSSYNLLPLLNYDLWIPNSRKPTNHTHDGLGEGLCSGIIHDDIIHHGSYHPIPGWFIAKFYNWANTHTQTQWLKCPFWMSHTIAKHNINIWKSLSSNISDVNEKVDWSLTIYNQVILVKKLDMTSIYVQGGKSYKSASSRLGARLQGNSWYHFKLQPVCILYHNIKENILPQAIEFSVIVPTRDYRRQIS